MSTVSDHQYAVLFRVTMGPRKGCWKVYGRLDTREATERWLKWIREFYYGHEWDILGIGEWEPKKGKK